MNHNCNDHKEQRYEIETENYYYSCSECGNFIEYQKHLNNKPKLQKGPKNE
jgi:hypothetical protein